MKPWSEATFCHITRTAPPAVADDRDRRHYWLWSAMDWQRELLDAEYTLSDQDIEDARDGCVIAWNNAGRTKSLLCC